MRFITRGRPIAFEDVEQISNRSLAMWDEHGYGPWGAFERVSDQWIGRIGLNLLHDWPGSDRWEIGFEIAPHFWGRGFATEGAREAIRFGFEDVHLARIISVTVPDHHASRRVMEKAGLGFQGQLEWRGTQVVWYAVDHDPRQPEP
jgi:RimJ/RimL family protein N-acetyltransferase